MHVIIFGTHLCRNKVIDLQIFYSNIFRSYIFRFLLHQRKQTPNHLCTMRLANRHKEIPMSKYSKLKSFSYRKQLTIGIPKLLETRILQIIIKTVLSRDKSLQALNSKHKKPSSETHSHTHEAPRISLKNLKQQITVPIVKNSIATKPYINNIYLSFFRGQTEHVPLRTIPRILERARATPAGGRSGPFNSQD